MKVGLFFGSFNPIHVGHLILADFFAENTDLDQIWLIVSPQNPHKEKKTLLKDYHRLELVRIAIEGNDKLRASDVEFKLPIPSYTIKTLTYLKEKYPDYEFSLLMGEDNLKTLHKWFNYEEILNRFKIYVYPRIDSNVKEERGNENIIEHPNVNVFKDVPMMKISASYIRKAIKEGKSVRYLLTYPVLKYIDRMNFYKQ